MPSFVIVILSVNLVCVVMLSVDNAERHISYCYAKCRFGICDYAECSYAECQYKLSVAPPFSSNMLAYCAGKSFITLVPGGHQDHQGEERGHLRLCNSGNHLRSKIGHSPVHHSA